MFVREFYGRSDDDLFKVVQAVVKDEEILERNRQSCLEQEGNEGTNSSIHIYSESTDTVTLNDVNIETEDKEEKEKETGGNYFSTLQTEEEAPARQRRPTIEARRKEEKPTADSALHQMQSKNNFATRNMGSLSESSLSTRDWMWLRAKQSLMIEHEWFAPMFVDREMGFYTLPSRILVWACVVLGQFVVESLFYNVKYPERAQDCSVYAGAYEIQNISMLYNQTIFPNGTTSWSNFTNSTSNGMNDDLGEMTSIERFMLQILLAAMSMPLPMLFFNINISLAKSMRNSRVFEFAGIVGLVKLREFTRSFVRVTRNSVVSKRSSSDSGGSSSGDDSNDGGDDDVWEVVMRGSSGCAYVTDDDSFGILDTLGTFTICCSTETSLGTNGPKLSKSMVLHNKRRASLLLSIADVSNIKTTDDSEEKEEDNTKQRHPRHSLLENESESFRLQKKQVKEAVRKADEYDTKEDDEEKNLEKEKEKEKEKEDKEDKEDKEEEEENESDGSSGDEDTDLSDDDDPNVSYSLVLKNEDDVLELHFGDSLSRDQWKTMIDDWTSKSLSSDASTMLECETAEGCMRELRKRYAVLENLHGDHGLERKYAVLIQRCEEWLHHARKQREYASTWDQPLELYEKTLEEENARRTFKRRVMMEQAKRDEAGASFTLNNFLLLSFS